jgi:hypothetical protein
MSLLSKRGDATGVKGLLEHGANPDALWAQTAMCSVGPSSTGFAAQPPDRFGPHARRDRQSTPRR